MLSAKPQEVIGLASVMKERRRDSLSLRGKCGVEGRESEGLPVDNHRTPPSLTGEAVTTDRLPLNRQLRPSSGNEAGTHGV